MDTLLYHFVLSIAALCEGIVSHFLILTLIFGALFIFKVVLAWRRGKKKPVTVLFGLGLLGFCLWSAWPGGRYTAQEDSNWLTLKGAIPAEAKLRCESYYRPLTPSYTCLKSPSFFDSDLSEPYDDYVTYEEAIDFSEGAYTLTVPQRSRRGSCEYQLSHVSFFDDGRWLFLGLLSKSVPAFIRNSDALTLVCHEYSTSPEVTCASDLPKQPWGRHDVARLPIYNPDNDDVSVTVNIAFSDPDAQPHETR